jgi:hypothetical protein
MSEVSIHVAAVHKEWKGQKVQLLLINKPTGTGPSHLRPSDQRSRKSPDRSARWISAAYLTPPPIEAQINNKPGPKFSESRLWGRKSTGARKWSVAGGMWRLDQSGLPADMTIFGPCHPAVDPILGKGESQCKTRIHRLQTARLINAMSGEVFLTILMKNE